MQCYFINHCNGEEVNYVINYTNLDFMYIAFYSERSQLDNFLFDNLVSGNFFVLGVFKTKDYNLDHIVKKYLTTSHN